VTCDQCQLDCSHDQFIFHCPVKGAQEHPCGYDVCAKCATKDEKNMPSCVSDEQVKSEPEVVQPIQEKEMVVTNVKNEEEEEEDVVIIDPLQHYPYANEARSLIDMGFSNVAQIMELLTRYKGNLDQVIGELTQY